MKKDQFIVICADTADEVEKLLPWGHFIAERLHKELFLLTCSEDGKEWIETFGVPFVVLKNEKNAWKTAIDGLPTVFNAVLSIALADKEASRRSFTHPQQLLKNFKDCKIAYLLIPRGDFFQFSTVALTINHQRESKEKLVWASYFARFLGSRTVIMHHNYRDAAFKMRWKNNMRYLEKIYSSLGITYDTVALETGSEFGNPDLIAIKELNSIFPPAQLFIALVADPRDRDLGDLFTVSPELRILRTSPVPILFLNQRDDLYILCD